MAKIIIELPGEPHAKQRPRLGRYGNVYTPAQTQAFERSLGWAAKLAMKGQKPLGGPLRITVTGFVAIPKSYTQQERLDALAGRKLPRFDGDNFLKCCQDAINGIVYWDDNQLADGAYHKRYAAESLTRIEVETIFDSTGESVLEKKEPVGV